MGSAEFQCTKPQPPDLAELARRGEGSSGPSKLYVYRYRRLLFSGFMTLGVVIGAMGADIAKAQGGTGGDDLCSESLVCTIGSDDPNHLKVGGGYLDGNKFCAVIGDPNGGCIDDVMRDEASGSLNKRGPSGVIKVVKSEFPIENGQVIINEKSYPLQEVIKALDDDTVGVPAWGEPFPTPTQTLIPTQTLAPTELVEITPTSIVEEVFPESVKVEKSGKRVNTKTVSWVIGSILSGIAGRSIFLESEKRKLKVKNRRERRKRFTSRPLRETEKLPTPKSVVAAIKMRIKDLSNVNLAGVVLESGGKHLSPRDRVKAIGWILDIMRTPKG